MNFSEILDKQRVYFATNATKSIEFRKSQLRKFKEVILKNEDKLYKAIQEDFGKSAFETYSTEISFVLNEIDYFLKNINKLSKPKKVATNVVNQVGFSRIHHDPYGNTLIIGAWNYPYQVSLVPAICSLACGNTVLLKPSEVAPNTANCMEEIINSNFDPAVFKVVQGGIEETTELLNLRFDKMFFTGSPKVGKIIYEAAAKNLTPVVLELGGKSPVIITSSANLEVAARRIVWGKFLNAGQTCIAPDYAYVEEKIKPKFLELVKKQIEEFKYEFGSENFTRIINQRNFDRLANLIDNDKIFCGGALDREKLHISPTVLQNINWEDKVMQEEIFGPILPVLSYSDYNSILTKIASGEKPLAAYLFSTNKKEMELFTNNISFGGGCINEVLMHISNPNLPFGGVGNSGIGNYHGKFGFQAFTHAKAVMERVNWGEPNLKYPPYTDFKKKIIKKML